MDFKKLFMSLIFSATFPAFITACGSGSSTKDDEYLIGEQVAQISSLTTNDGGQKKTVAIYDETVHRIHQFNLNDMAYTRSVEVRSPEQKHYVLYDESNPYIVDLSKQGLSVFDKNGTPNHNPVTFMGEPRSAAFRPDLGLVVVYDSLMTVGILKISPTGEVQKSWASGPVLKDNVSIAAGDLNDDGNLILALSDSSVGVLDINASFERKPWSFRSVATSIKEISWVAPIPGSPKQILAKTSNQIALINVDTGVALSTYDLPRGYQFEKLARSSQPHVIMRGRDDQLIVAYAEGGSIKNKTLFKRSDRIVQSYLNLKTDTWSFVDTPARNVSIFSDVNQVKSDRSLRQYRFSDLMALQSRKISKDSQSVLSQNFIFELFPSPLGYAVRTNIQDGQRAEAKLFNLPFMK